MGLTLRPWEPADAPALVHAYADPDIHHWHARSMSLPEAESWVAFETDRWKRERGGGWAITGDGSLLGRIALGDLSLQEAKAEVSYWILPSFRGQEVASRALNGLADWAFSKLDLHRLELNHSTKNQASCRVACKAGFVAEGTMRAQALHLDGWHDMHAHGRLASDG
jgi:ribosomal-protein-alanine N-acetyltransferase